MREISRGTKGSPRTVSFTRFMRDMTPTMSPEAAAPQKALRKAKAKAPVSRATGSQFSSRMSGWCSILPSIASTETGCAQSAKSVTATEQARPSRTVGTRPSGREYRFKTAQSSFLCPQGNSGAGLGRRGRILWRAPGRRLCRPYSACSVRASAAARPGWRCRSRGRALRTCRSLCRPP